MSPTMNSADLDAWMRSAASYLAAMAAYGPDEQHTQKQVSQMKTAAKALTTAAEELTACPRLHGANGIIICKPEVSA